MDRKTLEQNYQKSIGASTAAELEQNYQRSGVGSLAQSVKQATQYNPSAPSTQPTQAAPAGASSRVPAQRAQSDVMKEQLDTIKKQRDDAAIKAGAYMRAGNMQQQAKEQQKIANKAAIEYENAYTQWKNQRNAEAVEDYNPDENKFKAGDAALSGVQNAFQSMRQYAAAASSYLSGNPEAQAWEAKALMEKGVDATEAVKRSGLADKREIPITDYKTQAELRHEKNVESTSGLERLALQTGNTIFNMVPSLAANFVLPGAGLPMMAASAAGNKYADAYEKYGNTDMAFALGTAAGGASMLTESFGGVYGKLGGTKLGQSVANKLMTEAPGLYNLANSVSGKWLRDALSEGIEEGAEDIINYAIEKSLTGESDEMDNFGYDMLLGALAGGVLGGGNAAMRSITYSRVGKALNASPTAVAQQVQEGMEKGAGTAPAIYAAEVQKNPSNQMVGRLYEANLTYDADSGLSKIQNDITQVSINEIKAMVSKADALAQAAQKLNVEATPQAVATAITDAQRTQSVKTAEDSVGQAFAAAVDNPANAGEKAYNSALAGVAANQGVAARINNDPVARQAFSQLTGVQFTGNTAQDIAAIEVATQNIAKSGKQAISQAEYAQRVAAAGEQAAAQFDADTQAQAEQMQQESLDRWLSLEQNTITDVDGKRHIKEITNTDVRGGTEVGYKKAEIPSSKKKAVAEVNNAAKYLGKTVVWFEGAVQVNGQYRLTNGYRAPDGTIYVNINARDPLMVTFGHEMFHDLVADGKYSGLIDTLVGNPDYANMVKSMMNAKTELYERNGIELDQNAAAEEVAADISGDLLSSRDMLEYIGARNTEAATGIKGFLNRILKKLKGKPSAQEAYNRLSEAQRALIDGMEGGARNTFVDPAIGEDVKYSIREEAPPEKTILGYKVFVVKDGKLYPPMVANPNAADTPVGVWLNADIGERAPDSKTGRAQVKAGGKGTQGGSGSLAFRPGWHLGEVPVASQFDRLNPETGKKELFPSNFVWAECLAAADIDYQEEAMSYGYTKSGKFQHSLAGLPKLPVDGYYKYRTNPRPDTVPWLITGAMKVNRILSDSDVAEILESKGITPPKRQGGAKTLEQLGLGKYADGNFSLIDISPDGMEIYETSLATQQLSESQKKKQYLDLIKNQYRGRTARLERNGHVVYARPDIQEAGKPVYGDRRSTPSGAKALRNSLADGDVFDLLENAEYDRSSRDTKNHKNADYFDYYVKTVQIDGKVYDLVADVKRAYGNSDGLYYTLHLVDNATKKAVVSQRPQTLGSSEPITASEMGSNSFSADMVPQSDTAVNNYSMQNSAEDASGKHSLMDIPAMDSTGRELSAEQREYFFGSKVVDAEDRLKPVYHGSPAVFTEFSPDFMSQHGSSEGQGFYFTDYKPMAEGYQKDGGQLLEGYLDIKKPLSDSEITLTRAEVKKLLQAVDPTGDEVLVNYDPAGGMGYPSKAWYNRALDATVKAAMDYSDSDSEILAEIANGGAGAGAVLEAARNTLGYDGYIVDGKYDNATVYVAFDSNQFKNIDNTTPTESKDIRYSLMEDAQYMADIDKAVSDATQKANEELKAAQAQVKDLRKQLLEMRNRAEYAELQTKVTEKPTVDPIKAKKDIGRFLRKNGITNDETIKTLTAEIEDAFNSVYRWEKTDIDAAAKKAADAILKEATIADPLKAEKADIRKSLSQRTFVVGEQLRGDIVRKYGSLTNFRKKYGNIIRIKTRENAKAGEGVAFDVAYSGLQSEFPGIFRDAATEWETFENTVDAADYAKNSESIPLEYAVDEDEFAESITNQLTDLLWSQKELVTKADKAKAKADAATEKAVEAERQRAQKEMAANDRWREAETKLLADMAAAKEREKAAKARADFMQKYDALSKQYRADLRANNQQVREKYDEKLSEAKDEFNRRRTQDRIDRVVREDRAKSKARLRTAEQKSTTTDDVAKVLTEMPKKDKEAFKAKAAESWRTFKRLAFNTKDELERFGNAVGDSRITYAANNVGQAAAAAQYSIGGAGQYDLNGKKISDKNLIQVFEPAKKAGLTEEFSAYLLHEHNVDRMSVREKAQRQLAELREKLNKEVKGFAEMTDENIATAAGDDAKLRKAYTEEQIAAARQYKQSQAWAEKQFDKPVFGSSVTADDSRAAAADLLEEHPEFEKWAKDVYAYLDGLMEVRRQGGLVSEDMVRRMKELYPHYVPTYRDMPSTSGGYSNPNSVAVNSTIKSAKGGNQDIMPLIDSIARQTLQTFSAAKKNILGNMLYEDAMDTTRDISEYIQSVTEEGDLVDLDADSAESLKNTLRIWVDGKPVTLHMSKAMADGFRPAAANIFPGEKYVRALNTTFKKLTTQWDPTFIVRNLAKDVGSAFFFSKYSPVKFAKNYARAVKEIKTNGEYWQLYQAMGGKGTTYYDTKEGIKEPKPAKIKALEKPKMYGRKLIEVLSELNEAVEQFPRLSEFISTMEDTGDVQKALYEAADITTNFGRAGFASRYMNATFFPFFNPGMQGFSKNVRNIIDRRSAREISQLIGRLLLIGIAPSLIENIIFDLLADDDDYKELSDYVKDSNIIIGKDGKYVKVPMGRDPSVAYAFTNRLWRWVRGESFASAFSGYPTFVATQIAPNDPINNNLVAAFVAMETNRTWYGGQIVSEYESDKPAYQQYDESTDAFSIWLGKITRHGKNGIEGLSPKKVNYLIDQYSGFVGNWVLPTFSKKADVPAVVKAFVVDSTRQNRLSSDFYEAFDIAQKAKDSDRATASDKAVYGYLSDQKEAAAAITKQLRELYDRDMTFADYLDAGKAKEIREKANDLYELRNEIYRNALEQVSVYEENAKGIKSADSKEVKRDTDYKTFGAEYALKEMNKATYDKATEYVAQGATYDQYYNAYLATRGITGDKDENGKTITNSASRKKKEAIDKAVPNATTKQKRLLYEAFDVSDRVW